MTKIFGLTALAVSLPAGQLSAQSMKPGTKYCFEKFGQQEFSVLVAQLPDETKKLLAADPDLRKGQTDRMRQLLGFGCQAEKQGIAGDPANEAELKNIRTEVIAVEYDRKVNKASTGSPFGWINDSRITEFYKDPANADAFEKFLISKVVQLHRSNPQLAPRPLSDDGKKEARSYFAKMRIAEIESQEAAKLPKDQSFPVELKVKLQQVQFLARALSDEIAPETSVSDVEIAEYIRMHSEFDTSAKRSEAEKLLIRAKAGEDFAALADQYSEDPGNTGESGKKNGGLYSDVSKGTMVTPFENAALSLQPGEIYPELVESDFGYHLIKLENKTASGETVKYDVRHILISTMIKDPSDPNARVMPIKQYVRGELESEKESEVTARIVAENPVAVAEFMMAPAAVKKTIAKPAARKKAVTRPARRRH